MPAELTADRLRAVADAFATQPRPQPTDEDRLLEKRWRDRQSEHHARLLEAMVASSHFELSTPDAANLAKSPVVGIPEPDLSPEEKEAEKELEQEQAEEAEDAEAQRQHRLAQQQEHRDEATFRREVRQNEREAALAEIRDGDAAKTSHAAAKTPDPGKPVNAGRPPIHPEGSDPTAQERLRDDLETDREGEEREREAAEGEAQRTRNLEQNLAYSRKAEIEVDVAKQALVSLFAEVGIDLAKIAATNRQRRTARFNELLDEIRGAAAEITKAESAGAVDKAPIFRLRSCVDEINEIAAELGVAGADGQFLAGRAVVPGDVDFGEANVIEPSRLDLQYAKRTSSRTA